MATWFEIWFDTHYYHLLYGNRNDDEALTFIERLTAHISLPNGSNVLDLGCGKGRHSVALFKTGLKVKGVDLSKSSIDAAQVKAVDGLSFEVQDMRNNLGSSVYDGVFNLFTSFGYFDGLEDNLGVLNNIYKSLKPGGVLVIDFMNAYKTKRDLVKEELKRIEGVEFGIERWCDDYHFYKQIDVLDGNNHSRYTEKVQYIDHLQFESLLLKSGFTIDTFYGAYDLSPFDPEKSSRLVIVARKSV